MSKPIPNLWQGARRDDRLLKLAKHYREQGYDVYPVDEQQQPMHRWQQDGRIPDDELADRFTAIWFADDDDKRRVVAGTAYRVTADKAHVDLDCAETAYMAPVIMPPTACYGRAGSPTSHLIYNITSDVPTTTVYKPEGKSWPRSVLLELFTGDKAKLVTLPGSVHKGDAEIFEWHGKQRTPSKIDGAALKASTDLLAAVSIIAHHFGDGSRDELTCALVFYLRKYHDADADRCAEIVARIASFAGENQQHWSDIAEAAHQRAEAGKPIPAKKAITENIGADADLFLRLIGAHTDDWPLPADIEQVTNLPPVPLDALPKLLRARSTDIADLMNVPIECGLNPLMAQLLQAAGSRVRIRLKQQAKFLQPAMIYCFAAVRSGGGKSPAMNEALKPAYAQQKRNKQDHKAEVKAWKDGGSTGPKPKLRVDVITDYTPEGMVRVLDENPAGVLVVQDELSSALLARYSANKDDGGKQMLCSAYDGMPISKVRAQEDKGAQIDSAQVNIVGNIQPEKLRDLISNETKSLGLVARFSVSSMPDRPPVKISDRLPDEIAEKAFSDRYDWLYNAFNHVGDDDAYTIFSLTGEAQAIFDQAQLKYMTMADKAPEGIAEHLSKYPGTLGRLALCFWLATFSTKDLTDGQKAGHDLLPDSVSRITGDVMQQALTFLEYLHEHSKGIYAITDQVEGEKEGRALIKLLAEMNDGGTLPESLTASEVRKRHRSDLKTADKIRQGFDWLELMSFGRVEATTGRGRPTDRFVINPRLPEYFGT